MLEETKTLVIAECAAAEFLLAQDELDNQALIEALSEALETGYATGSVGAIDTSSVQVRILLVHPPSAATLSNCLEV